MPRTRVQLALAGTLGLVWLGLQLAGIIAGHPGLHLGAGRFLSGLGNWPSHRRDPAAGFPNPLRSQLPAAWVVYLAEVLVLVAACSLAWWCVGRLGGGGHRAELAGVAAEIARSGLASTAELRKAYPASPGSLLLGMVEGRPVHLSTETSVGVVMGSRMGKTSAAVGWVLDAPGPVLATSTKVDLVYLTAVLRERSTDQPTLVLDPEGLTGWPDQVRWSRSEDAKIQASHRSGRPR